MRLLAYSREERYPTAELAARDLVGCQDASRDGRGELVRLLDERFPRVRRQGPLSRQDPGSPSTDWRTVTGPWPPIVAPLTPPSGGQQGGLCLVCGLDSSRQWGRWWALACGALALVLATTTALFVLR
jgi:hypothetical protein